MQKDFIMYWNKLHQIQYVVVCASAITLHGVYMRISNCYASLRREKDKLSFLEAHEHLSSKIQVQVLHLSTEVRNMLRSFFFLSQVLFATYRQFWEAESKRSLHVAGGVFDLILKFLLIPQNCILSSVNQNPGSLGNLVCPRIHWRTRIANGGVQTRPRPVAKVFGAKQVYLLDIMTSAICLDCTRKSPCIARSSSSSFILETYLEVSWQLRMTNPRITDHHWIQCELSTEARKVARTTVHMSLGSFNIKLLISVGWILWQLSAGMCSEHIMLCG